MRRTLMLAVLLALGLAWSASADEGRKVEGIEGTWFCEVTWASWFGPVASEMLLNANAGGTLIAADTDDLTGFNPTKGTAGSYVQGPGLGGWLRTGRRAFSVNYSPLGYVGVGPQAGLFALLCRFRCAVELHGSSMDGACDVDGWWGVDVDGDGNPNLPNPVTVAPDFVIPDLTRVACTRIPVLPKR